MQSFIMLQNKILQSLAGMDCSDALAKVQAKFTNGESVFAVFFLLIFFYSN